MKVDMKIASLEVTLNCTILFLLTNMTVLKIYEEVATPQSQWGVLKYFYPYTSLKVKRFFNKCFVQSTKKHDVRSKCIFVLQMDSNN